MFTSVLLLLLLFLNLISEGRNHVGQPCNKIFRICLASNSYCDEENICRCKPDFPVNISVHSCKKGKQYSEKCDYSEECSYYDRNSYCSQLPYRSTCECHAGFIYNEGDKACEKIGGEPPKPTNRVFPTVIGVTFAFASIFCFCLVIWQVCKRQNLYPGIFGRSNVTSRSQYLPTSRDSQRPLPSAPHLDEALPNYDTVLKNSEDHDPPPSYDEVISQEQTTKT
ncbi:uncharacterized protein [Parasteatoda tepidariorum]|nr:uncharacterized protein LOC107443342 [Parasteatoda tepidariorum]